MLAVDGSRGTEDQQTHGPFLSRPRSAPGGAQCGGCFAQGAVCPSVVPLLVLPSLCAPPSPPGC